MSEPRYFQSAAGGVLPWRHPPVAAAGDEYTEVQVVPLDAIVIRREELPEVKVYDTFKQAGAVSISHDARSTADDFQRLALAYLAFSAHLRLHPPVDERAVDELQDLLIEMGSDHARHIAHALIATGRVKVEP